MTNEQFSARLRQHLLDAANEHPAQGQLAAIVDRVAVSSQRPTLVARLPWYSGSAAPAAASALRWGLVAVAAIGAAVLLALIAAGSRPRSTGFEGTWTATDPADGSTQYLVVTAGRTPVVHFVDTLAPLSYSCQDDPYIANGSGVVDGNRLSVRWPEPRRCESGLASTGVDAFTYHAATDSFIDDATRTWVHPTAWTRADDATVVPTRTPEWTPGPPDTCVDGSIEFDAPGTYTAPAGSLTLTVNVPGAATVPWSGRPARFVLRDYSAACGIPGGGGWIEAAEITRIKTDACAGTTVAVETPEQAIEAVSSSKGIDVVAQTDVTIGGHSGTRFDLGDDPRSCPDGPIQLVDGVDPFEGPQNTLYLIDVNGTTLALVLYGYADWPSAVQAHVDEMIGSMQIAP